MCIRDSLITVMYQLADIGPGDGGLVNLPAAGIVLILTALLMRATREASLVNGLLVACKVGIILAFLGVGVAHLRPELWHPFVPDNAGTFGAYGWSGVFRGAAVVFFAFVGFETVATAAGECRAPQRDAPVGLIGSLLITTIPVSYTHLTLPTKA